MDPLVIAVADTSFMELLLLSPGLTTGAFLLQNNFQTSCTIVSQWCTLAPSVKEIIYDITQISVYDCPSGRQDAHQVS
jgi:hypothetical protein